MDTVFNDKIACHGEAGLINACEMMREVNCTKVRADVMYLNRKGHPCRRYRPCCIEFWEFGKYKSFNVYGDGFVSKWVASVLASHYSDTDVHVYCFGYDTPRSLAARF